MPTNAFHEDFRIYQYNQNNAAIFGNEISLRYHPVVWFETEGQFEFIRGQIVEGDHLPFIPHDKLKYSVHIHNDKLGKIYSPSLRIQWVHAFEQNRPSEFETVTPAYNLFNARVEGSFKVGNQQMNLALNANNLLNELYFDHLSTLKEIEYYNPGRNITLSVQWKF